MKKWPSRHVVTDHPPLPPWQQIFQQLTAPFAVFFFSFQSNVLELVSIFDSLVSQLGFSVRNWVCTRVVNRIYSRSCQPLSLSIDCIFSRFGGGPLVNELSAPLIFWLETPLHNKKQRLIPTYLNAEVLLHNSNFHILGGLCSQPNDMYILGRN